MRVFKDRNFVYKMVFLAFIFALIFFLPITGTPFIISRRPLAIVLVLVIFAVVIYQQFKLGNTRYIITDKSELIITVYGKELFKEPISAINAVTGITPGWEWIRSAFIKSKKHTLLIFDGRKISVLQELVDENGKSLPAVLESEFKVRVQ